MNRHAGLAGWVLAILLSAATGGQAQSLPATQPGVGKLPHLDVDLQRKQVRVECQAVNVEAALEFFCVGLNGPDHETVLRTPAKPSDIHLALLMLGLQPGTPARFSQTAGKWLPPHGPPLNIFCEFEKDGRTVRLPAYRMLRHRDSKQEMPPHTWVFTGSRVMEDGQYAADGTGYVVSVVNFDLTLIDIPDLASSANEALEWELNPQAAAERGQKLWMVIEPAPAAQAPQDQTADPVPASQAAALSDVNLDEQRVQRLREEWEQRVRPQSRRMREAAATHYQVIESLQREQHRLIDEADRIQRVIDQLQRDYQQLIAPRPATQDAVDE